MKFGTDIHALLRMNRNNADDPLTCTIIRFDQCGLIQWESLNKIKTQGVSRVGLWELSSSLVNNHQS